MENVEIVRNIQNHIALSDDEADYFFSLMDFQQLKKNEILIRKGDDHCTLNLIKEGCLMTYFTDSNNFHHVIQFGRDMWWTGDLDAFVHNSPSIYAIKAIIPSEVYLLSKSSFEALCEKIPSFERYFRIIFQNSLIKHQQRIIRNISFTAEEKYIAFIEIHPQLELIVPQKYIASYLGITPEFLSKLKRRLAKRK